MKNKLLVVDISSVKAGSQKVTKEVVDNFSINDVSISVLVKERADLYEELYKGFDSNKLLFSGLINRYFGTGNFSLSKLKFSDYFLLPFLLFCTNLQVLLISKFKSINVIYCYDPKGIVVCGLFARLFKIKLIWHLHGKLNYPNRVNKFLLNLANDVIVPSNSIKNSLKSFVSDLSKVEVVYNGFIFDDKKNKKSEILHQDDSEINILYVGTIVPNKGIHAVVKNLIRTNIQRRIRLTVLGEPVGDIGVKYKGYVLSLCQDLPLNVEVDFRGWVTSPRDYYNRADLLVFSSLESCELDFSGSKDIYKASEALPTVLIESIMTGTPVLANRAPGVDEIVYNDCFGIITANIEDCDFDKLILETASKRFSVGTDFYEKFSEENMKSSTLSILKRNF
ncbi:glycosyltransferase [Vibrio lentus]